MFRYLMTTFLFLSNLPKLRPGFNSGYQPPSNPPSSGASSGDVSTMAYASLALGVLSWTLMPMIAAVAGAVIGWVELQNIKQGKSSEAGKTITQIGFWLSVANIALALVGTCVTVAVMVLFFGSFAAMMAAAGLSGA